MNGKCGFKKHLDHRMCYCRQITLAFCNCRSLLEENWFGFVLVSLGSINLHMSLNYSYLKILTNLITMFISCYIISNKWTSNVEYHYSISFIVWVFKYFFICYLGVPRPTLGHCRGDSLSHLMLITAFLSFFDPKVIGSIVKNLGP